MGGLCKWFRFWYCIFEFWINEGMVVSLCVVIAFWLQKDEFEYAYIIRPLNHPRNISAVKAESESWRRAFRSHRQDATGTRPWCWWQPSLLPSHARKPAIIKQWFELAVVHSAFLVQLAVVATTHWIQTCPCSILPIKRTVLSMVKSWSSPSVRVVASYREAVVPVQPCVRGSTHQVSTVSLHE